MSTNTNTQTGALVGRESDATLPPSVLTRKQTKEYRKDFIDAAGNPVTIIAEVRHDDSCGNGHNSFAITADVYERDYQRGEPAVTHANGKKLWLNSGGCQHDLVADHFPQLAPFIKWHMVSTNEPTHYVGNTIYHAGDRDCHGLRKGDQRQLKNGRTGELCWELVVVTESGEALPLYKLTKQIDSNEKPASVPRLEWRAWCREGEGKERDLDAARHSAVWPEATDEQLSAEPAELKAALMARLPALMEAFKRDVESLGLVY